MDTEKCGEESLPVRDRLCIFAAVCFEFDIFIPTIFAVLFVDMGSEEDI